MSRKIAVVMGSDSDYETMKLIIPVLKENAIDYDFRVISAHRTPEIAAEFAKNAKADGYDLIIAGAGMSAHLAGVLAAFTGLPVIGVPIKSDSSGMHGLDSLLSIIQMPPGIPVAAVGVDNTEGAAALAVKMINGSSGACDKALVNIVYDGNLVSEANLEKLTKALAVYGIGYNVLRENDAATEAGISGQNNAFAIINLTDMNIEQIAENDEAAGKIPVIEVPIKAASDEFNATSDKIFKQTASSKAAAFVGVNSYQNAAHMAARICGINCASVYEAVVAEHSKLAAAVSEKDAKIRSEVDSGKN